MKTRLNRYSKRSGSVLVITLILAVILGTTLGGYLMWVRSQTLMVAESQAWNGALALAEAGIEEGMAQLNVAGTNFSPSAGTNFSHSAGGVYGPRVNTSTSGGSYSVTISNDFPPTVFATGNTMVPYIGRPISRTVMVKTSTQSAFGNAVSALQNVDMNGNDITVDSYDSNDPAHSTNGLYNAATRKAGGDVSTTDGLVSVGNAQIYGKVRTSPWDTSTPTILHNGRVGDLPANWPATSGIEDGWYLNDFNATFPDVVPPYTSGLEPARNTGPGTNTYVLGDGLSYIAGDFSLKNKETLYVSGAATLYVTGGFDGNNGSYINIAPGASLKLYVGSPSGPAVSVNMYNINNQGNAYNFQFYGLPTVTSLTWSGNNEYVGTVYAPEAVFTLNGGGSSSIDYQGSCVVQSVKVNGSFNIHYDENLKRQTFPIGWTVASWREL